MSFSSEMNPAAFSSPDFVHILNLHTVYGSDNHGPKIRFDIVDETFLHDRKGIYIITKGSRNTVAYCGMCGTKSFRNSLLFNNPKDLHFHNQDSVRREVGMAIEGGDSIKVHAQTEEKLRQQLIAMGKHPADLQSLPAIKKVLIDMLRPGW